MTTPDTAPAPFNVGDVAFDIANKRVATITAVRADGFDYTYDRPILHRVGGQTSHFVGGTCYPTGYDGWRLATWNDRTRALVGRYNLGYYFNPGGVEFFSPAQPKAGHCQCHEAYDDEGERETYEKLLAWTETHKDELLKPAPASYTYYSEGVVEHRMSAQ